MTRMAKSGVRVLGPFGSWLGHVDADGWHTDAEGQLNVTRGELVIATYRTWMSVERVEVPKK